ncbi:unnamed protein product [Prorocentrum cordatum]|uniref:Transmembrane protein 138 n=1 Tax=Prorocentrum cordatum TaxID=2364126 RepID=A0ABN9UQF1_9DINO|nr:unnamed protein product [Polarella glacialis]
MRAVANRYVDTDDEEQQGLIPCRSMDLNNDPRFFNDNVLDKRLAAFTALSVVSSIMVGAACDNFIPFEEDKLRFDSNMAVFRSCVALVGFFLMCVVFLLNVVATMVFGVQFYYVYRLMTAGQVGCMLVIKMDGDRALQEYFSYSVLVLFTGFALFVYRIARAHESLFRRKYYIGNQEMKSTLLNLEATRGFA